MTLPLGLMPVPRAQYFDADGAPLAGGQLQFFVTGTNTPLPVFLTSGGSGSATTIDLDGNGFAPAIFLSPTGYRVNLVNAANVTQPDYPVDGVENVAETFLATLATTQTQGSKSVSGPYTVLASDNWITALTGPVNLPAAATRGTLLTIQDTGSGTVAVTPNGSEQVNSAGAGVAFTMASHSTLQLSSDGISNWYVLYTTGA
jgi:hypothetical protein